MRRLINLILLISLVGALISCAQKDIQRSRTTNTLLSDTKHDSISTPGTFNNFLNEDNQATTTLELWDIIDELIIKSQFSTQQKHQLNELCLELEEKLEINDVINIKLRALLFTELLSSYYNERQISVIKAMLERNHLERNSLLFDAIRITNLITKRTSLDEQSESSDKDLYLLY